MNIEYYPSKTCSAFMKSEAFYRGIRGPIGSGKSVTCCMEIMRRAKEQEPGIDGIRRTRWAIIRNTYKELDTTTKVTWLQWFPEDKFGAFNNSKMAHHIKIGDMDIDVLFLALDKPKDIKKLLSLEITGAWINEAREIPKAVVDAAGDRSGRFPSKKDKPAHVKEWPTWHGVIMDTNAPDEDHWWFKLAEENELNGWKFFTQPGGILEVDYKTNIVTTDNIYFITNPKAENIENLPTDYYEKRVAGKLADYARVYYANQYGFVQDGKPIFPQYKDSIHCAKEILEPIQGLPILSGIDFGLTPAVVLGQRLTNGRLIILDEIVTENMGAKQLAQILKPKLHNEYNGYKFDIFGDPAGNQQAQTDKKTPFQILNANGIPAKPAPTNDFEVRTQSVASPLSRLIDGLPGLIISPKCKMLRKALAGGYCFKRVQVAGDARFHDKPDKNKYSHIAEALGYLCVGAGEGNQVLGMVDDDEDDYYINPRNTVQEAYQ